MSESGKVERVARSGKKKSKKVGNFTLPYLRYFFSTIESCRYAFLIFLVGIETSIGNPIYPVIIHEDFTVPNDLVVWTIFAQNFGKAISSFLCIFLLYFVPTPSPKSKKIYALTMNKILVFSILSLTMILVPLVFVNDYIVQVIFQAIAGMITGVIECICVYSIWRIWSRRMFRDSMIHVLFFFQILGSFFTPLLIRRFLSLIPQEESVYFTKIVFMLISTIFSLIGVVLVLIPTSYKLVFGSNNEGIRRKRKKKKTEEEEDAKEHEKGIKKKVRLFFQSLCSVMSLMSIWVGFIQGLSVGISLCFFNYMIKFYESENIEVAELEPYLQISFFGAISIGRFLMLLLCLILTDTVWMILSSSCLILLSSIMLLVNKTWISIWICNALFGLFSSIFLAGTYNMFIRWVSNSLKKKSNPMHIATLCCASSVVSSLVPIAVGIPFEHLPETLFLSSLVVFCFVLFIMVVFCGCTRLFSKLIKKRKIDPTKDFSYQVVQSLVENEENEEDSYYFEMDEEQVRRNNEEREEEIDHDDVDFNLGTMDDDDDDEATDF